MPQMMPMYWLLLNLYLMILMIFIIIMIYFIYFNFKKKQEYFYKNIINFKFMW